MLSTPKNGWADITIGNWTDRCSYINDVAVDLLEAVLRAYETGEQQVVEFDAEGWEYIIVLGGWETYVITVNETNALTTIDLSLDDFVPELLADIRENLESWAMFPSDMEFCPDRKDARCELLLTLCNKVQAYRQEKTPLIANEERRCNNDQILQDTPIPDP